MEFPRRVGGRERGRALCINCEHTDMLTNIENKERKEHSARCALDETEYRVGPRGFSTTQEGGWEKRLAILGSGNSLGKTLGGK